MVAPELFARFDHRVSGVSHFDVKLFGEFAVLLGVGGGVVIKLDPEIGKIFEVIGLRFGNQLLGRDPKFARFHHDRGAVCVVTADVDAVTIGHAVPTHPEVGLHVTDQVADVNRTVGIGECGSDESFWRFHSPLVLAELACRVTFRCRAWLGAGGVGWRVSGCESYSLKANQFIKMIYF